MQVHTRTEHDVTAILQGLVTDGLAYVLHQFGVPGRCQASSDRETRGIVSTTVTITMGINMHASRTITLHSGRDAKAWDTDSCSSSSRHELLLMSEHSATAHESIIATAHQELGFLLQGHRLEYFFNIVCI